MLPLKIKNVITVLTTETKDGTVNWEYDSYNSKISTKYNETDVVIQYKFDFDNEVSSFSINLTKDRKVYDFSETAYESDYDLINRLYQEAIAADFGDFT